jgi:hypothetical protein
MDEFLIYGEPIKGWTLLRAMKDVANMRAGEWGLAFTSFFFAKKDFLPSFVFNEIPEDSGVGDLDDDFDGYVERIEQFERCMIVDPQIGFAFYNSCLFDGFDPALDDFHLFVSDRIQKAASKGQSQLSDPQLKVLMEIFVSKEEYEKAALVRDRLERKKVGKIF